MVASLKTLLSRPEMVIAPGAHDALAARIYQQAGFCAVYMTGNGLSASLLAAPDTGLLTMTEMVQRGRAFAAAVTVPVIADADTGYGNLDNVTRTVGEYEAAGVAAIHLEDQITPKRCGAMAGIEVIPTAEHAAKIAAAVTARTSEDFLIIGRTDARAPLGLEEAVRRARTYADADLVLVEMLRTPQEIDTVVNTVNAPVMFNAVDGKTPHLTPAQFADLGIAVLAYPLASTLVYTQLMQEFADHLAGGATPATFHHQGASLDDYTTILTHGHQENTLSGTAVGGRRIREV